MRSRRLPLLFVAAMAVASFGQAWTSLSAKSLTFDEVVYIPAGYSYVTTGDYRLNPEHPPLATWEPIVGHVLAASGTFGLVHAAMLLAGRVAPVGVAGLGAVGFKKNSGNGVRNVLVLTVGFGGQSGATVVSLPDSTTNGSPESSDVAGT